MKSFLITQLSSVYPDHPQEDYTAISSKEPIFVVADGVTRWQEKGPYPNPSGAAAVAKLFCEEVIKEGEKEYPNIAKENLASIFEKANKAVADYNAAHPHPIPYKTTGAFAVVKGTEVYWGSMCDSYVLRIGGDNKISYTATPCKPITAVVDGKEESLALFHSGVFTLQEGERLLLITDGFEPYVATSTFIALLKKDSLNLKEEIEEFTKNKIIEDKDTYGQERSLIYVSL